MNSASTTVRSSSHFLAATGRTVFLGLAMTAAWTVMAQEPSEDAGALVQVADRLMAEEHRASVKKVVVLPGISPTGGGVTGSYNKETDGLLDGIDKGREFGVLRRDVTGIPIDIPISILTVPGMIFGGLSGTVKRQIQEVRDAMTEDLMNTTDSPLSNDALATDVFWRLRDVPGLDPKVFALTTPIPEDTDALLYVSFSNSTINIDGDMATITFTATATLRRVVDGQHLYENQVHYQDTDSLKNWTENDKAAWHDYANYARHYVGREIVAELFERVQIKQALTPKETDTVSRVKKQEWQGITQSRTPTLAWNLDLTDDGKTHPWAANIGEENIYYDVEVYDSHQLVYVAKGIADPQHTIDVELEDCKTYRWSVRPSYHVSDMVRYGEWMRSNPDPANGNLGKESSEASAYIYDFASLEVKCARR